MMAANAEVRIITDDVTKLKIMKEMECAFRNQDSSRHTREFYIKICENAEFLAAFCGDLPCGYVAMYANDYNKHDGYVTSIAVSPDYQKCGVGQALLDKAIHIARQLGMKRIRLEVEDSNGAAIHFYKKNSFIFEKRASSNTSYMIREILV